MAAHKSDTFTTQDERNIYQDTLPEAQRVSAWSTSTLWSIIILFAFGMLTLIVGGVVMLSK